MWELTDLIYFLPVPVFLGIAIYTLKQGKTQVSWLFCPEWVRKDNARFWGMIVFYIVMAFVFFVIAIFLSMRY